jgi:Arc/MetJ-type ribon-helix-helix transcriptional regulator
MIPEFERYIGVRLSEADHAKLQLLVKEGKFKSISQVIRKALDQFFKNA